MKKRWWQLINILLILAGLIALLHVRRLVDGATTVSATAESYPLVGTGQAACDDDDGFEITCHIRAYPAQVTGGPGLRTVRRQIVDRPPLIL